MRTLAIVIAMLSAIAPAAAPAAEPDLLGLGPAPEAKLNLRLKAPINTWDEAVPLGNGLLGGLLWGKGNLIRLSLDRGDLWDERPAPGIKPEEFNWAHVISLVRAGKAAQANRIMDYPYSRPHPTKLPAGRLEIELDGPATVESFELDLASARGIAHLDGQRRVEAFFIAAAPVAMIRLHGAKVKALRLTTPFGRKQEGDSGPDSAAAKALGYPPAAFGLDATTQWYVQEAADGLKYCVCVGQGERDGTTELAVAVTSSSADGDAFAEQARKRVAAALAGGFEHMLAPHVSWWKTFWARSAVALPATEEAILRQYYLVRYFYGAASRRGSPPMPLQGVWTADNGGLPPWKGDYHNDLNTQMTYIAYHAAGHFHEGECFLDYLFDRLPTWRAFAKDFYGAPGAAIPGVMSLAGRPLGGWGQYSLSPTMGAWNAHLFYLHWLYTGDDAFLRERAWPFCREIGLCLLHLLKDDADGRLVLPLSSSPEIHNNSARAWLVPNTNYDLACMKMLFLSLTEMASALGRSDDAKTWRRAAERLGDFYVNDPGELKLDRREDLAESHRHLSNLMAIHPFNLITVDGGEAQQRILRASCQQWDRLGTKAWCGYSFSWMACLRARAGEAEAAAKYLDLYVRAFVLRNGFHANGDQTRSGLSNFTYRPFTLEGNFLAMQAVHEMLLQSWSASPGEPNSGVIRIFPALPARMARAEFRDLRAEGGHVVSARRDGGRTAWLRVTAGRSGPLRIADPFADQPARWTLDGAAISPAPNAAGQYEIALKKGQALEAAAK